MNLSTTDAGILLAAVTALTAYFVAWLRALVLPEWVKFAIAAVVSGVGGALTAYVGGTLHADASILENLAIVYTASRLFYFGAFQVLGLEKILLPKAAVIQQAKDDANAQLADLTHTEAKKIIDPSAPPALQVEAKVV